jgi:glutathione synthase/RimK-type ligase-like ATP-grasp enzyme
MIINILIDYKNRFQYKCGSIPYRSGMDKLMLQKYFKEKGYTVKFFHFSEINFNTMNFKEQIVLYTSSEDIGYHYKSYIEDIILGLQLQGAILIPDYKYLRANNNKVFMEILRKIIGNPELDSLKSSHIGVISDLKKSLFFQNDEFGYVIKTAEGAMSRGVSLAKNYKELIRKSKKVSKTKNLYTDLRDIARKILFRNYKMESKYRQKFIIQEFIPNLQNDWKVLVYWDKAYILKRYTRKNDFRSSGSGNFFFEIDFPEGILDFALKIQKIMKLPCISLDICFDNKNFHVVEFQAIYFGTTTLVKSPFYYERQENRWVLIEKKSILEEVYVSCIDSYIKHNNFT